jgi:hypothetical protein
MASPDILSPLNERVWQDLARHTRTQPLLFGKVAVRGLPDGRITIGPARSNCAWLVVIVPSMAIAGIMGARALAEGDPIGMVFASIFLVLLSYLVLKTILRTSRLECDPRAGMIEITYGSRRSRRRLAIPAHLLGVQTFPEDLPNAEGRGRSALALCRKDLPHDMVRIANTGNESDIEHAANALRAFCDTAAAASAVQPRMPAPATGAPPALKIPDSLIDRTPMGGVGSIWRIMTLRAEPGDRLAYRRSGPITAFVLTVIGIIAWGLMSFMFPFLGLAETYDVFGVWVVLIGAGTIATFGALLAGFHGGFGTQWILADHRRRVVTARTGWPPIVGRIGEIPFEDIAAVQISSRYVSGEDGGGFLYEANLVLANPPGERIHMLVHPSEGQVRSDAAEFARFLGVPVLDHASGRKDL